MRAAIFVREADTDSRVLERGRTLDRRRQPTFCFKSWIRSKLGWRAPSDRCLDEIAPRWPDQVQIVVDACQMRLGRPRLRKYLDRGYLVLVTGSKFFTGPAFSGALLVPARLVASDRCDRRDRAGACEIISAAATGRSAGRRCARVFRSGPISANGCAGKPRWRKSAAYYRVPDEFRRSALAAFGSGVERIIASSPSLGCCRRSEPEHGIDDEELAQPTIFPFVIRHDGRAAVAGRLPEDPSRAFRRLRKIRRRNGRRRRRDRRKALPCRPARCAGRRHRDRSPRFASAPTRAWSPETWSPDDDTARRQSAARTRPRRCRRVEDRVAARAYRRAEFNGGFPWSLSAPTAPISFAIPARTGSDLPGSRRWRSKAPIFVRCATRSCRRYRMARPAPARGSICQPDRATARRQAGRACHSGRGARLSPVVPLALFGRAAEAARAGACGSDGHGRQHADRIPAGKPASSACCLVHSPDRAASTKPQNCVWPS